MVDPDAPPDTVPLLTLLREDFERHDRRLSVPGLHAVVVHRLGRRTQGHRHLPGRALHQLLRLVNALVVRNRYGIEVGFEVEIGRRLHISHQGMIVLNNACRIGNDCVIRQGVTMGARNDRSADKAPELRDRVEVAVNAVLVGPIVVGEDARIGPGAVVLEDVPARARVLAPAPVVVMWDDDGRASAAQGRDSERATD